MPTENETLNSTVTIDKEGGWIVTHYTKTWDVRTRLDALPEQLAQARKVLVDMQADVAKLEAQSLEVAEATVADVSETPK